jgi:xylan 1,4-beta-xylosidase
VALEIGHLPATGPVTMQHFRIDKEHSDAYAVWQQMNSPAEPTPEQYAKLEQAGQLAAMGPAETVSVQDGKATLHFALPRQAVSFLEFAW